MHNMDILKYRIWLQLQCYRQIVQQISADSTSIMIHLRHLNIHHGISAADRCGMMRSLFRFSFIVVEAEFRKVSRQ